ncbi:MAG: MBL fold metallo-hydrolase [Kiritimatiellaeota bacterium]|nr:MBL fold metallo-hydrolase [Kiritimatiellota bacterium]
MYFEQITTPGLGCFSYAIGCPMAGVMAVVDPRRDIGVYLRISEEQGMRITHIFDTHIHADHISGTQQLRDATSADIHIHESAPVGYAAKKLKHGDEFTFGSAIIRVLHTPGHTPNSVSFLVADLARSPKPAMILTGDLLFVGDIGRPDLPGAAILDGQIENLHNSLYTVLGQLPDGLEVYPAHGQGSLCGQGMSAKPSTTLGYERLANPMLRHPDFTAFRQAVLSHLPMRPQSFSAIIAANMTGDIPILPTCEPAGQALSVAETDVLLRGGALLLDLRDRFAYGTAHIPGSINVDASSSAMLNWIGVAVPPGRPLVLILPAAKRFEEMRLELQRIGYDTLKGWLKGGMSAWLDSGRDAQTLPYVSASRLRTRLAEENPPLLIDVRSPKEFEKMRIEDSLHLPFDRLLEQSPLPEMLEKESVVICQSGFRASIAASLLQAQGCAHVSVLASGLNAWQ